MRRRQHTEPMRLLPPGYVVRVRRQNSIAAPSFVPDILYQHNGSNCSHAAGSQSSDRIMIGQSVRSANMTVAILVLLHSSVLHSIDIS